MASYHHSRKNELFFSLVWHNCGQVEHFTKFLIDSTGVPVKRYAPIIPPKMIAKEIERELHI